jgi:glycosyltransferase involved in cell wall biosynthesis
MWAAEAANALKELLSLDPDERQKLVQSGRSWVKRFDAGIAIAQYLEIYKKIFDAEMSRSNAEALKGLSR